MQQHFGMWKWHLSLHCSQFSCHRTSLHDDTKNRCKRDKWHLNIISWKHLFLLALFTPSSSVSCCTVSSLDCRFRFTFSSIYICDLLFVMKKWFFCISHCAIFLPQTWKVSWWKPMDNNLDFLDCLWLVSSWPDWVYSGESWRQVVDPSRFLSSET